MLAETLRIAQVILIVLIVVTIVLIIFRRMKGYAKERYLDAYKQLNKKSTKQSNKKSKKHKN